MLTTEFPQEKILSFRHNPEVSPEAALSLLRHFCLPPKEASCPCSGLGRLLMSRSKKVLITLDKNKSGAMTREKDHALENSDLLCPAQLSIFLSSFNYFILWSLSPIGKMFKMSCQDIVSLFCLNNCPNVSVCSMIYLNKYSP